MHADHQQSESEAKAAAADSRNVGLFADIPRWIWRTFFVAWASVFALFVLFFATNEQAAFSITIAVLFAMMAFGLPATLAAQSGSEASECRGRIETRSGPLSVSAAAAQILSIPFAALLGLTAFIVLAL